MDYSGLVWHCRERKSSIPTVPVDSPMIRPSTKPYRTAGDGRPNGAQMLAIKLDTNRLR
jgi:hypothetical protein